MAALSTPPKRVLTPMQAYVNATVNHVINSGMFHEGTYSSAEIPGSRAKYVHDKLVSARTNHARSQIGSAESMEKLWVDMATRRKPELQDVLSSSAMDKQLRSEAAANWEKQAQPHMAKWTQSAEPRNVEEQAKSEWDAKARQMVSIAAKEAFIRQNGPALAHQPGAGSMSAALHQSYQQARPVANPAPALATSEQADDLFNTFITGYESDDASAADVEMSDASAHR
ncbi:MAG: hypothetical protein ACRYF5_01675 [Janthinobacterium lividum]